MNNNLNLDLLKQDVEKEIREKALKIFIMLYLMSIVVNFGPYIYTIEMGSLW